MKYATVEQIEAGFRPLNDEEAEMCNALIDEAGVIIDACNKNADEDVKRTVTCRMIRRALGNSGEFQFPLGATQASASALGYTQSFTTSGGAGELYLGKTERKLLGVSNRIGARSPLEDL